MKATNIQIGKSYEVTHGRGTTTAKVLGINQKTGAWICETINGKEITIGDAKRFLKVSGDDKGKGKKQEKAENAAIARLTPESFVKKTADQETLDRLLKAVKDAEKRLRTARNSLHFGFINQGQLNEVAAEYEVALAALRKAGGKAGSGGRCLGQMSGLDAAYKVLTESSQPLNARQICDMAVEKGYWEPQGATPDATISSAILAEMKKIGDTSRFERVGKGLFAARK